MSDPMLSGVPEEEATTRIPRSALDREGCGRSPGAPWLRERRPSITLLTFAQEAG